MQAAPGLHSTASSFGPDETFSRLVAAIGARGLTLFARIDHAAGAVAAGLTLRPTQLAIFGNARGGTPLMQLGQTIGIDLPLRALVWQDESGRTWLSYDDVRWLTERHHLPQTAASVADKLDALLRGLAAEVTGGP